MTRREAIKTTVAGTAACAVALSDLNILRAAPPPGAPFELPPLPYAADALEPHLDARTMEIHHGKHHAGYVAKLNDALAPIPALAGQGIEELLRDLDTLPESVRTAVRNHGGGHCNHSLFWQMMKKDGGGQPRGELARAIAQSFGAFDRFQDSFTKTALGQFGSGWAWLTLTPSGLQVEATPNQDTPLSANRVPLLGLDVWEHAYYLKYQNKRADYIAAWWNVVNWDYVAGRYAEAQG
jgi:Fe-Mn family superoxide dismutase